MRASIPATMWCILVFTACSFINAPDALKASEQPDDGSSIAGQKADDGSGGVATAGGSAEIGDAGKDSGGAGLEPAAGGSGGAAGAPGDGAGGAAPNTVIDDMEDGDQYVSLSSTGNGAWFAGNDGTLTGLQFPLPSVWAMTPLTDTKRPDSHFAIHTTSRGFTKWGALVGAHFRSPTTESYDASAHCGVQLGPSWPKLEASASNFPTATPRPKAPSATQPVPRRPRPVATRISARLSTSARLGS